MILTMSLLHWLISQSLFVYAYDIYEDNGSLDTGYGLVVGTGFSIEAIVCGEFTSVPDFHSPTNCSNSKYLLIVSNFCRVELCDRASDVGSETLFREHGAGIDMQCYYKCCVPSTTKR
jgi:hypothetical protein